MKKAAVWAAFIITKRRLSVLEQQGFVGFRRCKRSGFRRCKRSGFRYGENGG
jgi:hypothetical protein